MNDLGLVTDKIICGMEKKQSIRTKDGVVLQSKVFEPEQTNHSVIVIGPSGWVNQDFYEDFARFLKDHHYTVITFDFRGTGLSRNGYTSRLDWRKWGLFDLDAVILWTKNQYLRHEIIYVGHQISGEIIGLAKASQFIHRIILINSGLSSWQWWPYFERRWIGIFKWVTYLRYNRSIMEGFKEKNSLQFKGTLLSFSFTDDWLVSQKSVAALLYYFKNAHIEWYHLAPVEIGVRRVRHLGFFRPKVGLSLWARVVEWIERGGYR